MIMINTKPSGFHIITAIVILLSLVMGLVTFIFCTNIKQVIVKDLSKHALNSATTIAAFIENDIGNYEQLTNKVLSGEDCKDDAYYQKMLLLFQQIKKNNTASLIYTETLNSKNDRTVYILDAEDPGNAFFSPIGATDSVTDTELFVFTKGKPLATDIVHAVGWGDFITGWAPIINHNTGKTIGIVGVDISADYVNDIMMKIVRFFILGDILFILLAAATIYRLYVSRFNALNTDYLTGALSKRFFESTLRSLIGNAKRNGTPFVLGIIDIDDFKDINDKYGHVAGDIVLKSITKIVQTHIRKGDVFSRLGGDEFAILLDGADLSTGEAICERILKELSEHKVIINETDTISVTVSIGIAEWDNDSALNLKEKADSAMYCSKNTGKNTLCLYKKDAKNNLSN